MIRAQDLAGFCWMHSEVFREIVAHHDGSKPGELDFMRDGQPVHWGHLVVIHDAILDRTVHWKEPPVEVCRAYYEREWRDGLRAMKRVEVASEKKHVH